MEWEYRLQHIAEAASEIWKEIQPAKTVLLEAEMGAGKTTLIQAICRGLGVEDPMSSPTFAIINEYSSPRGPIFHIDLYRCSSQEEAIRAGVEDCLYSSAICFVEWPSKAPGLIPADSVTLSIETLNDDSRKIIVNRTLYRQNQ